MGIVLTVLEPPHHATPDLAASLPEGIGQLIDTCPRVVSPRFDALMVTTRGLVVRDPGSHEFFGVPWSNFSVEDHLRQHSRHAMITLWINEQRPVELAIDRRLALNIASMAPVLKANTDVEIDDIVVAGPKPTYTEPVVARPPVEQLVAPTPLPTPTQHVPNQQPASIAVPVNGYNGSNTSHGDNTGHSGNTGHTHYEAQQTTVAEPTSSFSRPFEPPASNGEYYDDPIILDDPVGIDQPPIVNAPFSIENLTAAPQEVVEEPVIVLTDTGHEVYDNTGHHQETYNSATYPDSATYPGGVTAYASVDYATPQGSELPTAPVPVVETEAHGFLDLKVEPPGPVAAQPTPAADNKRIGAAVGAALLLLVLAGLVGNLTSRYMGNQDVGTARLLTSQSVDLE